MASKYKKGAIPYEFLAIPREVINSKEWIDLPPNACKLAIALVAQYTGRNNGQLCAAFEYLQHTGFSSKTTVISAKRALLECPFVLLTRQGHAPRTSDWVGFTWWKLDWHKSMDIDPRGFPYLNFVKLQQPAKTLRGVQKLDRWASKAAPGGTETGPIDPPKTIPSVQKLYLSPNEEAVS